jgi:hypothetical protein
LEATNQAYYSVDPLTTATLIQAAAWAAIGFDPLTGGVQTSTVLQSSKAGSASDTFADAALAAQARADALKGLVPEAERVLRLNNLLIPNPWVFG